MLIFMNEPPFPSFKEVDNCILYIRNSKTLKDDKINVKFSSDKLLIENKDDYLIWNLKDICFMKKEDLNLYFEGKEEKEELKESLFEFTDELVNELEDLKEEKEFQMNDLLDQEHNKDHYDYLEMEVKTIKKMLKLFLKIEKKIGNS